jgi:hypothetical protein
MVHPALQLRKNTSSEEAMELLVSDGLTFPSSPATSNDIPGLPDDLTLLDDGGLMDLFTQLTAWCDYVGTQHATATIDERDTERRLEVAEANAVTLNWGGTSGERVAIAKAKIALDPDVQALKKELQERYAYRKLVETLFTNLDRDAALVSRELTRRTSGSTPVNTRRKGFIS